MAAECQLTTLAAQAAVVQSAEPRTSRRRNVGGCHIQRVLRMRRSRVLEASHDSATATRNPVSPASARRPVPAAGDALQRIHDAGLANAFAVM